MEDQQSDSVRNKEKFYGRKKGRPLRKVSQNLVDNFLPAVKFDEKFAASPNDAFPDGGDELWLEIGFGGGEHLFSQAQKNPEVNLIGAEVFLNGVVLLLRSMLEGGVDNVRVWSEDVRPLLDKLPEDALDRLFLLFPDPWPKARHHKRRFVSPENLKRVARVLKPGCEFRIATDHADYLEWIVEHMKACPDFKPNFQWDNLPTTRPQDWVPTRYEQKALDKGIVCTYLSFIKV